ncbi:hypothetical protein F5Y10DRAFT_268826 [Nemania abortiva]|nr:hypothetical protein F5Y10DRAFT_268826 [Nemania abortiva]
MASEHEANTAPEHEASKHAAPEHAASEHALSKHAADDAQPHDSPSKANSKHSMRSSKPNPSSPPSQAGSHPPPASPTHRPDVNTTDPEDTTQLWKEVMTYNEEEEKFYQNYENEDKVTRPDTPSGSERPAPPGLQPPTYDEWCEPPVNPDPRFGDEDFLLSVLIPWNIEIKTKTLTSHFYEHFGLEGLPEDPAERFEVYKKQLPLDVLLAPDTKHRERIQQEYCFLNNYKCNDIEYEVYALHDIFLAEPRHTAHLETAGEDLLPVRMLHLSQKPEGEWNQPKLYADYYTWKYKYNWEIAPDCSYYLSLQSFPLAFRDNVDKYVAVVQTRAVFPYLTIEFSKDHETASAVQHRIAIASTIALYNRWRLKFAVIGAPEGETSKWTEDLKFQMRHYSITFTGSKWELWYTTPKAYDWWKGAYVSSMYRGDCSRLDGVELLLNCINDIHYWGMTVHGKSCKADVEAVLNENTETGRVPVYVIPVQWGEEY